MVFCFLSAETLSCLFVSKNFTLPTAPRPPMCLALLSIPAGLLPQPPISGHETGQGPLGLLQGDALGDTLLGRSRGRRAEIIAPEV